MADPKATAEQTNKAFEDVIISAKCHKQNLRVLNAFLPNSYECLENIEEDMNNILERKLELSSDLTEILNLSKELKNNLDKIELAVSIESTRREIRGRQHVPQADSGIESSNITSSLLSGIQDVTPHPCRHELCTSTGETTNDGDHTDC